MIDTEIPATRRSGSTDELARGDSLHESAEIENPNKNDDQELQDDELQGVPDLPQEFNHGLVDQSVPEHRDTSRSSQTYFWSREEKRFRVNITFLLTSRKTGSAISDWGRRERGLLAEDAPVQSCPELKILVKKTADRKVLGAGCESRHFAEVVQDLATQWIQSYPFKPKISRRPRRAYKSFWSRRGNQESLTLTILWHLAKLVKIFLGIIVRRHHTDQKRMGLLKGQYGELRKGHLQYCCNQVWMKNGGRIPWNVTAICETFKISEYRTISAKDLSRLHLFGPKVLPGEFLGYVLYAGRIWNGDIMVADIEEVEMMDTSEIHAKTQCKGSVNAFEWWKIHNPNRRWNSQNFWRRSGSENIHPNSGEPRQRRRTRKSSKRIRRVFFNPVSRLVAVWWWSKKWFLVRFEELYSVITLNPELNCTCREKNQSLFHRHTLTLPELSTWR